MWPNAYRWYVGTLESLDKQEANLRETLYRLQNQQMPVSNIVLQSVENQIKFCDTVRKDTIRWKDFYQQQYLKGLPFNDENTSKYMPTPFTHSASMAKKPLFKKIVNFLTKPLQIAGLAVLAPFKKAMKDKLEKEGVSVGNSMKSIAENFYHKVVKKDSFEYRSTRGTALANFDYVEPVTMSIIISAILSFFKNLANNSDKLTDKQKALIEAGLDKAEELIPQEERNIEIEEKTGVVVNDNGSLPKPSGTTDNELSKVFPMIVIIGLLYVLLKR